MVSMGRPATLLGAWTVAVLVMLPALAAAPGGKEGADFIVGVATLPAERGHFHGHHVVDVNEAARFLVVHTDNPAALRAHARDDANVRYLEEDVEGAHASLVPNDPYYALYQYDMTSAATNAEAAWDKTLGTTSVKLCVLDTGQNRAHQDLSGLTYYYWTDVVKRRSTAYDDNGHGTHVTGTAAALLDNGKGVAGVAPGVAIGAAKVLGRSGSGTWSQVATGITRCADAGSHVESLSLGGAGGSQALADAVAYAVGKGVFIAAAAGNGGPCTGCVEYPAKYAGVTAVSCSDQANALCSFSSQGPQVDLIAPGKDIVSTWSSASPCSGNSVSCYVRSSGTSMSTPHVAGFAALYKSTHPLATGGDIEAALKAGARDLGLGAERQGAGLVQGTVV